MFWKSMEFMPTKSMESFGGETLFKIFEPVVNSYSHWHWDHAGDPTRFPPETELVVGPGFKENLLPGYPQNPGSGIREDAFG